MSARATIDRSALLANLAVARECAPGRAVIAVVKANAYGHGAVDLARVLVDAGVEQLAVVTPDEASELREGGLRVPILVLGGVPAEDPVAADRLADARATVVVHDAEGCERMAAAAARRGTSVALQIEVETGMRRMGVPVQEALALASQIQETEELTLSGVFTHYASADALDPGSALEQTRAFQEVLQQLRAHDIDPGQVHAANSAALLSPRLVDALPEARAVRPGLMLYGVSPCAAEARDHATLTPVMSLRAPVLRTHVLEAGEGVGYGATWRANSRTRVATLGLGYADGVPWSSANLGEVWLAGALRPIRGRISMDSCAVEIGDDEVAAGEEAVFFGGQDGAPRAEDVAARLGSIGYEVLVRVGARVRRELV